MGRKFNKSERVKLLYRQSELQDTKCTNCRKWAESPKIEICKGCPVFKELNEIGENLMGMLKGERVSRNKGVEKVTADELTVSTFLELKNKGLTNKEIAAMIGISSSWLSNWKASKKKIFDLEKVKETLGESIEPEQVVSESKVNEEVSVVAEKVESEEQDNVNHPNHYTMGGIETYDYIKAKMSVEQLEGYLLGNILKYMSRYQFKNGLEDLKKSQWYLEELINTKAESLN
ncbi:DUF3310 domain-containing protein [Bacillus thuringiensis]